MEFVRWGALNGAMIRVQKEGALVLHDDAWRAAARAAERRGRDRRCTPCWSDSHSSCHGSPCVCRVCDYEQGQRDMLAKAIAAVEALEPIYRAYPHRFVRVSDILAALRALPPDGGE